MKGKWIFVIPTILIVFGSCTLKKEEVSPDTLSGIYPHMAYYNNEGECGIGGVVSWADRLWVITYGPYLPKGSSDRLYEITPDLHQLMRKESIGGTAVNRMFHSESNQLFIGPYIIDMKRRVRAIPYQEMAGRHAGNARHLSDPVHKIYYGTMEEGLYEVDVNSLGVKELHPDGNTQKQNLKPGNFFPLNTLLPGINGKGVYSGQGVLVYAKNGEAVTKVWDDSTIESGALAEWNGKSWKVVRRNQFTEVTGPGGIQGNAHPETDPLWTIGWDSKSLILGNRDVNKGWSFYRLPKASHSYNSVHGGNKECPRIRNIGTEKKPEYLMTIHGMFWRFPATFATGKIAGIRPRSAYLKVIGDFTRWNNQLVFGCNDAAQKETSDKRRVKGEIEGVGQSNSNLWFTSFTKPDELGPATADGAVWFKESIQAETYSEPFLFAGWDYRSCWIENEGKQAVKYSFEVDILGNGTWSTLKEVTVEARMNTFVTFSTIDKGEWIRLKTNTRTTTTVGFSYTEKDTRNSTPAPLFKGIATVDNSAFTGGLLYGLGNNQRTLGIAVQDYQNDKMENSGYYELTDSLRLIKKDDPAAATFIRERLAIPQQVVSIEKSSVLIVDDRNRRWRLPLGHDDYSISTKRGLFRICREVVAGRDLFNCHGTFYELPAEGAGGYAGIRPVSSHSFAITDYASYRGLLVMTGIDMQQAQGNKHILISDDKKTAVWAGCIDDLWQMGKPLGRGGPWMDTDVRANIPSDPYLMAFYDKKMMKLSHRCHGTITFTVEIDPTGNGHFIEYSQFKVNPGQAFTYYFPEGFHGRWIRFKTDKDVKATAWLEYQ